MIQRFIRTLFLLTLMSPIMLIQAEPINLQPLVATAPQLPVRAYLLMDADTGHILASKAADHSVEPASLTKLMSLYVISNALHHGLVHLDDPVWVSRHAWQEEGSRMFIRAGEKIPLKTLIQGVIVASGNDATMALAEHIAGSETGFVSLMNQAATQLKLHQTHFTNPTGMPNQKHHSSARDLAYIARQLIQNFPEHYHWYQQKWFRYNKIRQPNRNRLLWLDPSVDGLKTGHTSSAGYCLVASAKREHMRLIAVVLGAESDAARNTAAQQLLNYGFRFFETVPLLDKAQHITTLPVRKGSKTQALIGPSKNVKVTIPRGSKAQIKLEPHHPHTLTAPFQTGHAVGSLWVKLNDTILTKTPLVALSSVSTGSRLHNFLDTLKAWADD